MAFSKVASSQNFLFFSGFFRSGSFPIFRIWKSLKESHVTFCCLFWNYLSFLRIFEQKFVLFRSNNPSRTNLTEELDRFRNKLNSTL